MELLELMDYSSSESVIVVTSMDFGSRHLVAPRVLLAGVAKVSAGAVLLYLEDIFVGEGEERLGFKVRDWEEK